MKKKICMLFVIFLMLTGCGKKDYYKEAAIKMQKLKNYQETITFEVLTQAENSEVGIQMTTNSLIDNKNQITKEDATMTFLGISVSTESYISLRNKVSYTRRIPDKEWYKSEIEPKESLLDFQKLESYSFEKKEDSDSNVIKYQIIVPKEKMENLMGVEAAPFDYSITSDVLIDIEIDKKTGYVTKAVIDLLPYMETDEADLTKCEMVYTLSKFNEVGDLVIDGEIIRSAKEVSDDDFLDDDVLEDSNDSLLDVFIEARRGAAISAGYSYIMALENQIVSGTINGTLPNTLLESLVSYDGKALVKDGNSYPFSVSVKSTLPTKVDLVLKDGIVIYGTLVIDDFELEVSSSGEITSKN